MMKNNKKTVFYAILGHVYEHYESTLFSFIAPFVATMFFVEGEGWISTAGVYLAIASGFWMRPFGAAIFAWIGDKFGRRRALIYSVTLCVVPSTFIGLLPTYEMIGPLSPVLLIILRLAQGLSIGGGFYATLTVVSETSEPSKKNIQFGVTLSMGFLGAIAATFLSSFFLEESMPIWAWRIPFILGGAYGMILYFMKDSVEEARDWKEARKTDSRLPFLDAVREVPNNVIAAFLIGMAVLPPFYLITIWLPGYLKESFSLSSSYNLRISSLLTLVSGVGVVSFCWLATYCSLKRMLYISVFCGVLSSFALYFAIVSGQYVFILGAQIIIALVTSLQVAPSLLLIQELFPPRYKYSGFAIPFSIGQATLVGSTPFLAELIAHKSGKPESVTFLVVISFIFLLIATVIAEPHREKEL